MTTTWDEAHNPVVVSKDWAKFDAERKGITIAREGTARGRDFDRARFHQKMERHHVSAAKAQIQRHRSISGSKMHLAAAKKHGNAANAYIKANALTGSPVDAHRIGDDAMAKTKSVESRLG